jgi:DNA-binding PadR family transcriptional regulator
MSELSDHGSSLSSIQLTILRLLFQSSYRQKELQEKLGEQLHKKITPQNLFYHLNVLEKEGLIEKHIVAQIGNARINEILLNTAQLQRIRKLLGIEVKNLTLITGFGKLGTGYLIPDIVYNALVDMGLKITRVVCFTSPDALKVRTQKQSTENLLEIDQFHDHYHYETDYCNLHSDLYQVDLDLILRKELHEADIILDLTPNSKLFSFKLLEFANQYQLPCFFLGRGENNKELLIWMTGMKLEGKMNSMRLNLK